MTWAPEDVTDAMADRCIEQHTEPQLDCAYCPTRADERLCQRCELDLGLDNCQCDGVCDPILVDGFGRAIVVMPPSTGVRAA